MNAIKLLEEDHLNIKRDVEEIGWSTPPMKRRLFDKLKVRLEVHDTIVKNIFYPSLLADPKTAALPGRDEEACKAMGRVLGVLSSLPGEDKAWTPTFNMLREHLAKNILAKETEISGRVQGALSAGEINSIGHRMATERERLLQSY
jgi:hypothetical protein